METLCRVTTNGYYIDEEGYLPTHRTGYEYAQYKNRAPPANPASRIFTRDMKFWLPIAPSHDSRMLPLVHPEEWETIARFLPLTNPKRGSFRLLTIDKSKIESLTNIPHPALLYGEFFGRVRRDTVIKDEGYVWSDEGRARLSEVGRRFICEKVPLEFAERIEKGLRVIA